MNLDSIDIVDLCKKFKGYEILKALDDNYELISYLLYDDYELLFKIIKTLNFNIVVYKGDYNSYILECGGRSYDFDDKNLFGKLLKLQKTISKTSI